MRQAQRIIRVLLIWGISCAALSAQEPGKGLNVLYIEQSGYDVEDLKMLASMFTELTGVPVNLTFVAYADLLSTIQESAASYDVLALDQLWVAELAEQGIITPIDEYLKRDTYFPRKMRRDILPAIRSAFLYQERSWAVPFLANFQLLFYNQKLLKAAGLKNAPTSLEMLAAQMKEMKQKGVVEYPWTDAWGQNESLVADFVWLTAAFGGELFDPKGAPLIDQAPAQNALTFMVSILKDQLASPTILTDDDLAAKDDFLDGRAAFTSNWLFMEGLLDAPRISEIVGQASIGLLPASKSNAAKTASVSAFQGVAMITASKNKEHAWKWIEFFTSPVVERAFLFEMPIWTSVQTSRAATQLDVNLGIKREQLAAVHHRPNLKNYPQVSAIIQAALHAALQGELEPAAALQRAKAEIENLK